MSRVAVHFTPYYFTPYYLLGAPYYFAPYKARTSLVSAAWLSARA
jgi:hypothetical protein